MSGKLLLNRTKFAVLGELLQRPAATESVLPYTSKRFMRYRHIPRRVMYKTDDLIGAKSFRHLNRKKNPINDLPEEMRAPIETYNEVLFKVKGYDIVLVEKFAKVVHNYMQQLLVSVEVYAEPTFDKHLKELRGSLETKLDDLAPYFALSYHTRVLKVKKVSTVDFPILVQTLIQLLPQSVSLEVKKFSHNDEEVRLKRRVGMEKMRELMDRVKAGHSWT